MLKNSNFFMLYLQILFLLKCRGSKWTSWIERISFIFAYLSEMSAMSLAVEGMTDQRRYENTK